MIGDRLSQDWSVASYKLLRRGRVHWRWKLLLLGASVPVVASCDPGFRFAGSVRNNSGGPVAGADVQIQCPTSFAKTTTDSNGHFEDKRFGWCPDTCTIEVRSLDHVPWTGRVEDHCGKHPAHLRDACLDVEADIVLASSASGSAAPLSPELRAAAGDAASAP